MSNENNEQKQDSGIDVEKQVSFIKCLFICIIWFAFVMTTIGFVGTYVNYLREQTPVMDALYFISWFIILSTIIIVSQICRLNNSLKEIKKAIEDKQPVIIQKRVSASEQDKK